MGGGIKVAPSDITILSRVDIPAHFCIETRAPIKRTTGMTLSCKNTFIGHAYFVDSDALRLSISVEKSSSNKYKTTLYCKTPTLFVDKTSNYLSYGADTGTIINVSAFMRYDDEYDDSDTATLYTHITTPQGNIMYGEFMYPALDNFKESIEDIYLFLSDGVIGGFTKMCFFEYSEEAVVANFVPAKRNSDNKLGIYNTHNNNFWPFI